MEWVFRAASQRHKVANKAFVASWLDGWRSGRTGRLLSICTAIAMLGGPVAAQDAETVKALTQCRSVANSDQRLACYDKAAAMFENARKSGDVVVIDRAQIKAVRRQAFGLRLPTLDLLPHARKDDSLSQISLTVVTASLAAGGNWRLNTDEGTQWLQTDGIELGNPPHNGSKLVVASGALGSFFCKIDGQPAVRCQRVQ